MFRYVKPLDIPNLTSVTQPNGKRYYTLPNGKVVPSVTTVIGAKQKQSIIEWRKRVGEEEANRVSRQAASRGTNTHKLIENYLNNEPLGGNIMPDAKKMFVDLKPFLNKIDNIHYQEQSLWSDRIEMAGRVDCIGEYNGVLSIIDFKTSKRVKKKEDIPEYFAQCTAYALMYEELVGDPIDQLVVLMAVNDSPPLVFIEKTENHINNLLDYINFYRKSIAN